jgi:hypothetical protein
MTINERAESKEPQRLTGNTVSWGIVIRVPEYEWQQSTSLQHLITDGLLSEVCDERMRPG